MMSEYEPITMKIMNVRIRFLPVALKVGWIGLDGLGVSVWADV